ncbi:MAG: wax ester/triacylglycerol synthase family O-acyltransferase [Mycolicibacterium rufum]|nr:wax ester/triacylglycerol synthase family O-acyltransferase [Mycolicibacterium rufum]
MAAIRLRGGKGTSKGPVRKGPPPLPHRPAGTDSEGVHAQDADRNTDLAAGAVLVLEGPIPGADALSEGLGERLLAIPHLLGIASAVSGRLRHATLPHPGADEDLFGFVADAIRTPRADRAALWQCWVIDGLARDRWAVLLTVDPDVADSSAAVRMLSAATDCGVGAAAPHVVEPAAPAWVRVARDAVEGAAQILEAGVRAVSNRLSPHVTGTHRYSAVEVPLTGVAPICRTFGVALDDVALSAITDSFRAALLRRGEEPRHDSLRVSGMLPALPVDEVDRVAQLLTVQRRLLRARARRQGCGGGALLGAVDLLAGLPQRGVVAVTMDAGVAGRPQTLMDRAVVRVLPVPALTLRLRTAVAILNDGDDLVFGISSDDDAAPDVDEIAFGIKKALACLAAAARRPRSGRPALAMIHPSVANG